MTEKEIVFKQLGYIEGASSDSKNYSDILEAIELIEKYLLTL